MGRGGRNKRDQTEDDPGRRTAPTARSEIRVQGRGCTRHHVEHQVLWLDQPNPPGRSAFEQGSQLALRIDDESAPEQGARATQQGEEQREDERQRLP